MAHFGTYTYVTPFLKDVTRAGPRLITALLLAYGIAGIIGNLVAGTMARRALRATFTAAAGMLATATLLLPAIGAGKLGAMVLLILWGLAYGAVPVCSRTWFVTPAPHAPETASVLFTSSFQATVSLGALAGGATVDSTSTSAVMVLGGLAAILAMLTVQISSGPGQLGSPGHNGEPTPARPAVVARRRR
ncbi:membrane hypothetical protein [Actinacidiphila cocklensis]|uniref:Uncharacterized protein n=1 Tax=Actinacidiphila cocklensis TaxID=887465 RepID=A0A9W4GPW7_9ACTN|nr:membrane hypothetical protein [Actinacidiphila cocklensis]